jgi:hypothetical protein
MRDVAQSRRSCTIRPWAFPNYQAAEPPGQADADALAPMPWSRQTDPTMPTLICDCNKTMPLDAKALGAGPA